MAKKIRTVLVGCGGISRAWLNAAREIPAVQLVGIVDIKEDAARRVRDEFALPHAAVGTDLRAMLRAARPDAVWDCTVPEAHVDVTLEALRHGCHVMGEKPMADSMENARRMVAAARRARRTYAVIQNRRYDLRIRALRQFIAVGQSAP